MKKARKLDPGGIYKVVYPPENIFNLSNEEETKISDRAIQFSGWCLLSASCRSFKSVIECFHLGDQIWVTRTGLLT